MKIRKALISVADKSGLPLLAGALRKCGATIYSTGGTARALRECGAEPVDLSELTGFPEILDGRVKTLHPLVHAAILADSAKPGHMRELEKLGAAPLDLVAVNFYPFEKAAAGGNEAEIIENIDIGGPAMARAAAKNYASTAVLTDPLDYPSFVSELEKNGGEISERYARRLAGKAFSAVAHLDAAIANHFAAEEAGEEGSFSSHYFIHLHKQMDLKYGENPHQRAACYERFGEGGGYVQIQGPALSYNNLLDLHAACALTAGADEPMAAIVKHNNPCGAALGDSIHQAFSRARRCDPVSTFGGVVALNREVDGNMAETLCEQFLEAVAAPQFSPDAKEIFAARADRMRALLIPDFFGGEEIRSAGTMFLRQTHDEFGDESEWKIPTRAKPNEEQMGDLRFAWRVAAAVKSNAIVAVKGCATLGVGAGQMSRVDSARIACQKAAQSKLNLKGASAASDAFFPFADGLEALAEAGIRAVIQPGGSKKDAEIIAAADKADVAMVFTGRRHFRH